MKARAPKAQTLKKYGLSEKDWLKILESQGGVCAVCQKVPESGRLVTDHHHVRGFKKMHPSRRCAYVRGILCSYCNLRILHKGVTAEKLRRAAEYLESYERRRADEKHHQL